MPPVFAHGRLRLYLLKLLDEAPRHGYEIIRLLEERFQGLYAPSAGTVYPRLAKLQAEGLVTHATEGGRKVYSITDAGRAELADRGGELAELELEIRESVAALASDIREDVRGSAQDLRREMREAARQARAGNGTGSRGGKKGTPPGFPDAADFLDPAFGDREAWRQAKEEFRRAKEEWKEQARRAKEETRRAKQDAQRARKLAKDAQTYAHEEMQQALRRIQDQAQQHLRTGDWQGAVRDALSEVTREFGRFTGTYAGAMNPDEDADRRTDDTADAEGTSRGASSDTADATASSREASSDTADSPGAPSDDRVDLTKDAPAERPEPSWAHEPETGDPARDFDRLLDRFRDDLRDAARDHGVTSAQLGDARRQLAHVASRIGAALRGNDRPAQ
ncbi:helix-turn-helix transcriptional regulator [Streptomyces sp. NPDC003077]|uniref:helix-turn-helix transcriptional regulator n=1 Tax=Streptomyces sp. NPDC003077 TaxID=3154443 RepID=UPI0033BC2C6F